VFKFFLSPSLLPSPLPLTEEGKPAPTRLKSTYAVKPFTTRELRSMARGFWKRQPHQRAFYTSGYQFAIYHLGFCDSSISFAEFFKI
jgi:hypothetical protein